MLAMDQDGFGNQNEKSARRGIGRRKERKRKKGVGRRADPCWVMPRARLAGGSPCPYMARCAQAHSLWPAGASPMMHRPMVHRCVAHRHVARSTQLMVRCMGAVHVRGKARTILACGNWFPACSCGPAEFPACFTWSRASFLCISRGPCVVHVHFGLAFRFYVF